MGPDACSPVQSAYCTVDERFSGTFSRLQECPGLRQTGGVLFSTGGVTVLALLGASTVRTRREEYKSGGHSSKKGTPYDRQYQKCSSKRSKLS